MKSLTINDFSVIKKYLDQANYEGYNSNFVTMMMWNHLYHIQYEIHDHFLIMLHHYKEIYFWAMPFCLKEYYKEAIDYMMIYSKNHGFEFLIDCAVADFVEDVKEIYGNFFLYKRTPYNDDYVYDKNMLMNLSGKKMQKRRNHFNAFKKNYPDYVYKEIDLVDDFNEVLDCLNKWESDKEEINESLASEIYGIMYLLSSKHILEFKAAGIYIDNKMEAFIIGSKLNHQTIQIHVEKANKSIRGLYPAILKEFLEHNFSEYKYVNREEDMGLENLRKSKQSLHPIHMVKKSQIFINECIVKQAQEKDLNSIQKLWINNFDDETQESADFYFTNNYQKDYTYILKNKNTIISVCQIVPHIYSIHDKEEIVYFILGVCTNQNYQGQGCMKKLLNYVLSLVQYKDQKIYLQAYHPEIYYPFGFNVSHLHNKVAIDKEYYLRFSKDNISEDYSKMKAIYQNYVKKFDEYRIRDDAYFDWLIKRSKAFNDQIVIYKYNDQYDGYVILHDDKDEIYVSEIIYNNQESFDRIISTLSRNDKKIIIECDLKVKVEGKQETIIHMLSNYTNCTHLKDKFISEIY